MPSVASTSSALVHNPLHNRPPTRIRPTAAESDSIPLVTPPQLITDAQVDKYKPQDRYLPIANVARIMKLSLPPATKIAKEAKTTVQECTSEFISFITSEAATLAAAEGRKTMTGEDILAAMTRLDLGHYESVCKIWLVRYRQHQLKYGKKERQTKKRKMNQEAPNQDIALPIIGSHAQDDEEEGEEEDEEDDEDEVEEDG